ncbi:permease-like protein [Stylonychia lemnae]|uniref:Permease-like protein n=1 Tax=Stylonychia lemnae TaxID=5949 RepID=A0A078B1M9_STYLE|nr:permease-like protein [Stylonychia lemnae]|eukprot:CDW88470.1 permease-like protein [Stylonychia lemnae]
MNYQKLTQQSPKKRFNLQGIFNDGSNPSQSEIEQYYREFVSMDQSRFLSQSVIRSRDSTNNLNTLNMDDTMTRDLLDDYRKESPKNSAQASNTQRNDKLIQDQGNEGRGFDSNLQKVGIIGHITTNVTYLINDMRKRNRQFQIGLISVFLVVSFTTFVTAFVNSTPSLFFMVSQSNAGDFDITLTALRNDKEYESGNYNYYYDPLFQFDSKQDYAQFNRLQGQKDSLRSQFINREVSLLNMTAILQEIRDIPEIVGAFPRWMAMCQVANSNKQAAGDTGSFIIYGDQKLERDIGVANGFPNHLLKENEAMVSKDLMGMLGLKIGEQILVRYEFLTFLPPKFNILQTIAFDEIPYEMNNQNLTRGKLFLSKLNQDTNLTMKDFNNYVYQTYGLQPYAAARSYALLLGYNDTTPFYMILEDFFQNIRRDDFTFEQNYTVKEEISSTFGKWPSAMGNTVFLDSTYVVENFYQVIQVCHILILRIDVLLKRNKRDQKERDISRMRKYNEDGGSELVDTLMNLFYKKSFYESADGELTIQEQTSTIGSMKSMLTSSFFMITFQIFIVAFILYQSLIQSDVEERTYEFAMLRTLGYRKDQLMSLLSMQTLFFALPATIMGFIVMAIELVGIKMVIYDSTRFGIYQYVGAFTVFVGLIMGIVIPLMSNYIPIKQAMSKSLRDSLDVYRKSMDEFTVKMTRLENMGISPLQMGSGLFLTIFGFICYYFIPSSLINLDFEMFYIVILGILTMIVLGVNLISQAFVPWIENFIVTLIIMCKPKEKKLKPIIQKNLKSHRGRNMKTSLMFTMTMSFLMYSNTSFQQGEYMIFSMTSAVIGSDIALFRPSTLTGKPVSLEEQKLNEFFYANLYTSENPSGLITQYSYLGQTLNEILTNEGKQQLQINIGVGLDGQEEFAVKVQGLSRDHLEKQDIQYYYPIQSMKGKEFFDKEYKKEEIMELLYDLDEFSHSTQVQDKLRIRSEIQDKPYQNQPFEDTIINIIIPQAIVGLLPIKAGDLIKMCLGIDCQSQFRARVVATIRRMPGISDISGYRPAAYLQPSVIVSYDQMVQIISKYTSQNPQAKKDYDLYMSRQPQGNTNNIPKKAVYVNFKNHATDDEINNMKNSMVKIAGDNNAIAFDTRQFNKGLSDFMIVMYLFSGIVAVILFLLTFFQLIVSISSNIRDDEWELGVLRAMGMRKTEIQKITSYEYTANILTPTFLGIIIGAICASTMSTLFLAIAELPFKLMVKFDESYFQISFTSIIVMIVCAVLTIIIGTAIGSRVINRKSISQVLKGL